MAQKRSKGQGYWSTKTGTRRISSTSQRRVAQLVEQVGKEVAARQLRVTTKQLENWLKGTGRVSYQQTRIIAKSLREVTQSLNLFNLLKTSEPKDVVGEKEQRPQRFNEAVFDNATTMGTVLEASKRLQDASYDWRVQKFYDLATKKRQTREDRRMIVALLLSMGVDPHNSQFYVGKKKR